MRPIHDERVYQAMSDVTDVCYACINGVVWSVRYVCQFVGSILAVNYRLVTTVGHVASKIYGTLAVLLTSVIHVCWEAVCYLGLCIATSVTWFYSGICFMWHCCTLLCQIIYSAMFAMTDSFWSVIQAVFNNGSVLYLWLTSPTSFQDVLGAIYSYSITIWTLSIRSIAQCLKSFDHQVRSVICTIAYKVKDFVNCAVSVPVNFIIDFSYLLTSGVESCYEWLSITISCYGSMLIVWTSQTCEAICMYATSGVFLSIFCLFTLSMLIIKSQSLLRCLRHLKYSQDMEVAIHDFNDAVEISDEEQYQFESREDDGDVSVFGDDDMDVDDDDNDDESVDTLVTDHSDSDNEEEEIHDDEGSDVDLLSSTDSNDADDDSDDSDAISIQLPQRSTHENHVDLESRDGYTMDSTHCEIEQERSLCVICQDRVKSVLVLPCRHLCMCVDCAHTIAAGIPGQRRTCPLCRTSIRTIMNIYT